MTLVASAVSAFPERPNRMSSGGTSDFTFDAAGDSIAVIFQIPKTGTIDKVHYRLSAGFTGTLRIEIRTVDATTGYPNAAGTLYGSSTSISVVNPTSGNKTAAVNCTGATAGDIVAIVIDAQAYTSGACTVVWRADFIGSTVSTNVASNYPYAVTSTDGGGTQSKNDRVPLFGTLEYSGAAFTAIAGYYQWTGTATGNSVTTSGTTRRGNIFRPATKRRAIGIYAHLAFSGGTVNLVLYDSGGTQLAICTIDKDQVYGNAFGYWTFDGGATVTLTVGADYYVMAVGADATGATLYGWDSGVSGQCAAQPGGANTYGATYAGSFATNDTTLNEIGLITDQEDDGAGGGGGGGLKLVGTGGLAG